MLVDWIEKAKQPPTEADADPMGCVLVWHLYQGVMVYGWRNANENRFMTHWARTPQRPEGLDKHRYE